MTISAVLAAALLGGLSAAALAQEGEPNDARTIHAFTKDPNVAAMEALRGGLPPPVTAPATRESQPTTTSAPASQPTTQPAEAAPPPPPPGFFASLGEALVRLPFYFGFVGMLCVLLWLGVWAGMVWYALRTRGMGGPLAASFLMSLAIGYGLALPDVQGFVFLALWGVLLVTLMVAALCAIIKKELPFAFAVLIMAVLAFALGEWNRLNVSAIKEDRSAEFALAQKRQLKERKKEAEAIRAKRKGSDVHFVEDDSDADVRKARYTQAELNKMRDANRPGAEPNAPPTGAAVAPGAEPNAPADANDPNSAMYAYRRGGPKTRDPNKVTANDILVRVVARQEKAQRPPMSPGVRYLVGPEIIKAMRLSRFNLFIVEMTMIVALLMAVIEYLRRFNFTFDSIFPMPIAGRLIDSLWPKTHAVHARAADGRLVRHYLTVIAEKGETFLYFARQDPWPGSDAARTGPAAVGPPPAAEGDRQNEVVRFWQALRATPRKITWRVGDPAHSFQFVFESAWFGQYSFVVLADGINADLRSFLTYLVERLRTRRQTRAFAWRTVNLVWDLPEPPPADMLEELVFLCRETNLKLAVFSPQPPSSDVAGLFEEVVEPPAPNA